MHNGVVYWQPAVFDVAASATSARRGYISWAAGGKAWATTQHVVTVDLPGHGESLPLPEGGDVLPATSMQFPVSCRRVRQPGAAGTGAVTTDSGARILPELSRALGKMSGAGERTSHSGRGRPV